MTHERHRRHSTRITILSFKMSIWHICVQQIYLGIKTWRSHCFGSANQIKSSALVLETNLYRSCPIRSSRAGLSAFSPPQQESFCCSCLHKHHRTGPTADATSRASSGWQESASNSPTIPDSIGTASLTVVLCRASSSRR
jgi:hypothetical protein